MLVGSTLVTGGGAEKDGHTLIAFAPRIDLLDAIFLRKLLGLGLITSRYGYNVDFRMCSGR